MMQHLRGVWHYRHFWMALVRMDLRSRYRRTVLGIGWSLLQPVATSAVLCLVFSSIFPMTGKTVEGYPAPWRAFAAYLVIGVAVWDVLRNSLGAGCHALLHNEAYIRQCPLPYGIYPLRTVMGVMAHFLLALVALTGLVCLLKASVEPLTMLYAVLPVVPLLFLFGWGLATVAAFATVYFHDVSHFIDVGAGLMFFLTPIMYTPDVLQKKGLGDLVHLNPAVPFIEVVRLPLVTGVVAPVELYAQCGVLAVVAAALGCGTIGWLQKKVVFHL